MYDAGGELAGIERRELAPARPSAPRTAASSSLLSGLSAPARRPGSGRAGSSTSTARAACARWPASRPRPARRARRPRSANASASSRLASIRAAIWSRIGLVFSSQTRASSPVFGELAAATAGSRPTAPRWRRTPAAGSSPSAGWVELVVVALAQPNVMPRKTGAGRVGDVVRAFPAAAGAGSCALYSSG